MVAITGIKAIAYNTELLNLNYKPELISYKLITNFFRAYLKMTLCNSDQEDTHLFCLTVTQICIKFPLLIAVYLTT